MLSTLISDLKYCKLLPNFTIHYTTMVLHEGLQTLNTIQYNVYFTQPFNNQVGFKFFCTVYKKFFNLNRKKDNIMKSKAFWGGKNRDYAASLKNAVNFLAAQIYDTNFYGCFFTCLHMRTKVVV